MQFNGIGSGHMDMHQITNCMHEHSHFNTEKSAGASSAGTGVQTIQTIEQQQEGQFSLSAWLEKTLGNGKRLLRSIWGSNEIQNVAEAGDKSGEAQVLAQIREEGTAHTIGADAGGQDNHQPDTSRMLHTPQIAAAATAVAAPRAVPDNPYFAVEDTGSQKENLWQKLKVRFKDAAGQLAGHLPGKFSGFQAKNSFQAKQEKPKEDLRRHSKYRKDEVEIDCVLTDDSYLLDSYDRKGEYRRLSANK